MWINAIFGIASGLVSYRIADFIQQRATERRRGTQITWTSACGDSIQPKPTPRAWIVIILVMLLMCAATFVAPNMLTFIFIGLELSILAALSITDIKFRIIPNETCLWIMLLKLASYLIPLAYHEELRLMPGIVFDIVGSVICFMLFFIGAVMTGGNVGMGDVKLATAAGFLLGWKNAMLAIALMGMLTIPMVFGIPGIGKLSWSERMKQMIAFGPPFAMACAIVLIYSYTPYILF